jgi:hypothetical protein
MTIEDEIRKEVRADIGGDVEAIIPPEKIEQMLQQAFLDEVLKVSRKHGYALMPVIVSVPLGDSAPGIYVNRAQINVVKQL